MAQNKEQLDKLLGFISTIIQEPGNEEFTKKLRALVSPNGESNAFRFAQIEKYLGLDFKLDESNPIVDYSFVLDDFVRNQLISDNREMLRYRFGVRAHKVDFDEFCRYAALQVEMLMFYYYKSNFDTLDQIKADICTYYEKASIDSCQSLESIPLFAKTTSFCSKFDFKRKYCLDNLREVRNSLSHRSKQEEEDEFISQFKKSLKMFPVNSYGQINLERLKKDDTKNHLFKNMYEKDYYKYLTLIWKRGQPFDEVIETLQLLACEIKNTYKIHP